MRRKRRIAISNGPMHLSSNFFNIKKTEIEVEKINIKNLRKRWASLTKDKKTINLNVNLLKAPDDVLDYITSCSHTH